MNELSANLSIAPSQLYVHDLERMTRYYKDHVGLEVLQKSAAKVTLGQGQKPSIELAARAKLKTAPPNDAGLFHNAILFDSRLELIESIVNVVNNNPGTFQGTGDHLVSEAFYFADPEGNGLELYFDRPRDQWQWENGQVRMDTLYIDPNEYIKQHLNSQETSKVKQIGHVHLRVGDIAAARIFYVDILGFNVTSDGIPGALFVSVGGYHHNIGLNSWASQGAGKREMSLGLSGVKIHLDKQSDIDALAVRIEKANLPFTYQKGTLEVADPWNNLLQFTA